MHKLIPPFTRADADRVLDATLHAAARAEARGDVDAAFNLRADAEELRDEFAAHFAPVPASDLFVYLVSADGVRAARPVLAYSGADSRPMSLADVIALANAQGFIRYSVEDHDGVQVHASDARDSSGAFKSFDQCRAEAEAERAPGRFHCVRCGAARCACVDLGD